MVKDQGHCHFDSPFSCVYTLCTLQTPPGIYICINCIINMHTIRILYFWLGNALAMLGAQILAPKQLSKYRLCIYKDHSTRHRHHTTSPHIKCTHRPQVEVCRFVVKNARRNHLTEMASFKYLVSDFTNEITAQVL